ncbi:hypothetical protein XELAEV_18020089mg [Xenopus laevis]|uniref:Helix-turn-helix domain-containing protein n=1 Tax=Xenopus laevis TaxID=8355 RepID=A0A974D8U5_XENLA|nr:hypothetical protein XELAEV_18020089mg [Xenopus laevis]
MNYLDVTVYKNEVNKKLQTRIHQKLTDRNTLLHFNSSHPKHLVHLLPRSQMIQTVRITSDLVEQKKELEAMSTHFLERVYPKELIMQAMEWALTLDRISLLQDKTETREWDRDNLFYMNTYGPCSSLIKKSLLQHWPLISTDPDISKVVNKKLCFGYKHNRNLREISPADPVSKYVHTTEGL